MITITMASEKGQQYRFISFDDLFSNNSRKPKPKLAKEIEKAIVENKARVIIK